MYPCLKKSKQASLNYTLLLPLVLDTDKTLLTFAAANNPVWIIRSNELIECKADRMSVGRGEKNTESFPLKTLHLVKG